MRYRVIIEKGVSSYGAFVPDLPGCIDVGKTEEEVTTLIQEAILVEVPFLPAPFASERPLRRATNFHR